MKPTIERCIETNFFKKHNKHLPALLNLQHKRDVDVEIAEDITNAWY